MGEWPSYVKSKSYNLGNGISLNVPTGIRDTRKIPVYGNAQKLLDRWNHIEVLYENICGNPWELYVEVTLDTVPVLIKSLIEPGKIDIIKARLNHSYNCGFKQLFKDAEQYLPIGNKQTKGWLWRLIGPPSTALWYFFIAEKVTEFSYAWTTAVLQRQQCTPKPNGGPCQLSDGGEPSFIANTWLTITYQTVDNDPDNWTNGFRPASQISPRRAGSYACTASITFHNADPAPIRASLRIVDASGAVIAGPATVTLEPGEAVSTVVNATASEVNPLAAAFTSQVSIDRTTGLGVGGFDATFSVG